MAKKIMIVDDEPSLIELVSAILEEEGFEVIPCVNGKQALEKLKTEKPDLILLDMMMPGMTGREVRDKIKENSETAELKVIFLTIVKVQDLGEDIIKQMDISDYITKPFDNKDLINRIKKVIG